MNKVKIGSMENLMFDNDVEILKAYVVTLQACKKCGVCFQNQKNVYEGKFPLCKRCRNLSHKQKVVYVKFHTIDAENNTSFDEQYVIPYELVTEELLSSLKSLNQSTIISKKEGLERVDYFSDPQGKYFHETFRTQTRDQFKKPYNMKTQHAVMFIEYYKMNTYEK
jgi:hypothetical protein